MRLLSWFYRFFAKTNVGKPQICLKMAYPRLIIFANDCLRSMPKCLSGINSQAPKRTGADLDRGKDVAPTSSNIVWRLLPPPPPKKKKKLTPKSSPFNPKIAVIRYLRYLFSFFFHDRYYDFQNRCRGLILTLVLVVYCNGYLLFLGS